jgi:serine/threonine protein kinase
VKKARLRLTSKQKEDMYEMFRAEIKVMRMLRHPNIIKFYEVFEVRAAPRRTAARAFRSYSATARSCRRTTRTSTL